MTTNLLTPVAAQSAAPSVARPRGAGGGQDFASALDAADRALGARDVPATPGRADRSRVSDEPARDAVRPRDTGSADGAADPTGTASTDAPPSATDGAPGDAVQPTPAATSAATTAATPTPTAAATTAVAGAGSPVPTEAASGSPVATADPALPAPAPTSAAAPAAAAATSGAGTTVAPTTGSAAGSATGAAGTTLAPSAGTPTGASTTGTTGTTTDSTTGTPATRTGGATVTTPGGTPDGGAAEVSAGSSDVLRGPTADGPRTAADVVAVRPDPASVTTVTTPAGSAGAATGAPAPAASGAATVPAAAPAAGPSPATAPPLAEQLGARLATLGGLQRGTHVLTVPVDPEHLGPVRIVAHIGAESVRVELVGATDASRHALQQSLGDLRRDLAAAGLQVDVGDRRGASDPSAGGSRDGSSGPRPGTAGAPDETRGDRVVPTPTTAVPGHAGRLDLVV